MAFITYFLTALKSFLQNDLTYLIVLMALVVLCALIVAKVSSIIIRRILSPLLLKLFSEHGKEFVHIIEKITFRIVLVLGGYSSLIVFRNGFSYISEETHHLLIEDYPYLHSTAAVIEGIMFVILVLVLLFIGFKLTEWLLQWYAGKINAADNKDLSGSLFPLTQKLIKIGLTVLTLIIILAKFKIDISGFLVSLGVGSLAIALAAQETISNMISGFIIMTDRPFRIGDRIKIGNEITGDVVGIGIRSTKIHDFDKNLIVVPNNDIVKSRIINFTYPDNSTRCLIEIPLPYEADIDVVKNCCFTSLDVIKEYPVEAEQECFIHQFSETHIIVRFVVFAKDYRHSFQITAKLREQILKLLREKEVTAPYQKRIITITNENKG